MKKNNLNLTGVLCPFSQKVAYSCSVDGSIMVWDVATLQVSNQLLHFEDDLKLKSLVLHLIAFDVILLQL